MTKSLRDKRKYECPMDIPITLPKTTQSLRECKKSSLQYRIYLHCRDDYSWYHPNLYFAYTKYLNDTVMSGMISHPCVFLAFTRIRLQAHLQLIVHSVFSLADGHWEITGLIYSSLQRLI